MSEPTQTQTTPAKRALNPFALAEGLVTLGIAAYVLTGGHWFDGVDSRWLVAGAALVVGVLMLLSSLRPKRNR